MTTPAAPIVVGVDGSEPSRRALDWAIEEALLRRCPLRIVHAFLWPMMRVPLGPSPLGPPEGGLRNAAERTLAAALDRAREKAPDLAISGDMPVCAPAAALIDESRDAALVVVGNRGLGGFGGLLLGSVGLQVVTHAHAPVVVVRAGDAESGAPED